MNSRFEYVQSDYSPVDTTREVRELVAVCLWDVSMNCESGEQRYVHHQPAIPVDHFVFVGEVPGVAPPDSWPTNCERADLTPVYEMIFRRLKAGLLDWQCRLPQVDLIEFPSDRPDGRRS